MNEIIIIFSVFLIVMISLALRQWLCSWEGILKKKKINKKEVNLDDGDCSPKFARSFILIFETPDGKKIKLKVNSRRFNSVVVGAKYKKARKTWKFKKCD